MIRGAGLVRLEADLAVVPDAVNIAPRPAFGLPPSDADRTWDEMRVMVGRRLTLRAFDPGEDIETGSPIALVSMSGEALVTMSGEPLVSMVEP